MIKTVYTLITGASEGFGKALAIECARRKMHLILVALPGGTLYRLAGFLRTHFSVDVVCIEKDLCINESCMDLFNEVNSLGLQVNMLINNAGIGSTSFFGDESICQFEKQIKLNVLATTLITRLFLGMLKNNSPSYILNVGSLASFFSLPKKQVYGATKSYIYYFSKSLKNELKTDNVYVSVLCPGGMNTNEEVKRVIKTGNYLSRISSLNPESVAPVAIDGLLKKKAVIIPGTLNNIFLIMDAMLPVFIKNILIKNTMKKLNQKSGYSVTFQRQTQPLIISRAPDLAIEKIIQSV